MPAPGSGASRSFDSSSRTRSAEMIRDPVGDRRHRVATSPASTAKPSCAAKRAARIIRSGSSPNETSGAPGVRSRCAEQVLDAAGRVDEHLSSRQAQRHRVDREVAAHRGRPRGSSPNATTGLRVAPSYASAAVRRDLDGLAADPRADRAERPADVPVRVGDRRDDREDLVGRGVRREVEVGDRPVEEGVAHRAAHEGELVPGIRETPRQAVDLGDRGEGAESVDRGGDALHSFRV